MRSPFDPRIIMCQSIARSPPWKNLFLSCPSQIIGPHRSSCCSKFIWPTLPSGGRWSSCLCQPWKLASLWRLDKSHWASSSSHRVAPRRWSFQIAFSRCWSSAGWSRPAWLWAISSLLRWMAASFWPVAWALGSQRTCRWRRWLGLQSSRKVFEPPGSFSIGP